VSRRPYPWTEAIAGAGLFLGCFALVHLWFWGHGQLVDWPTYQRYGSAVVDQGRVPYRDFAVEYPPGALPVFVAPTIAGTYSTTFAWLMAGCGVLLVGVLTAVRREAAVYAALAPILVGSLILSRFDLWPALLATAALASLLADRHRLGWALLGAAVAAKLWPFVLVPPALVWSVRRGRPRSALAGAAVVALAFVPFAVVAPGGLWHSVQGQLSRPLQIESLGAAFATTFGHPHVVSSHGSQNVTGLGPVGALLGVVALLAVVGVWFSFWRGAATPERLVRHAAAAVAAFVAFDKVLSPQYLLWLIPLVPLVRGVRGVIASAVLTVACVLTQVWFPLRYWSYVYGFHLAWVVLLRDVALVLLFAVLVAPQPRALRR